MKVNLKEMIKLGFILALFAAAACVMLAFVYGGTKVIIDERQQADLEAALRELFPGADKYEEIKNITSPDPAVIIQSAYSAAKNNEIIGVALSVSRASYSGPLVSMVGVRADGFIAGVKILENTDTPGLGAHAGNPKYFVDRANGITFYGQFAGKNINDRFSANDDVVIITASTVTSQAVASSVKTAGLAVDAWLKGEEAEVISSATGRSE